MSDDKTIFSATDDFEDRFAVLHDPTHPQEWAVLIEEEDRPGSKATVILRTPQIEELFVALGRSLGEPGDVIVRRRAEREAADAAALRRVNEALRHQIEELRKELGR